MQSIFMITIPLLFLSFCAEALQERQLSNSRRSVVNISRDEFNRISVVGDRIENVFGMNEQFMLEADEKNGQIFLGVKDKNRKNISITIVTESGKSQDISMRVKEIPAQTILFRDAVAAAFAIKAKNNRELSDNEKRIFLLKQMIKNKEVREYAVVNQDKKLSGFKNIELRKVKSYLGMFVGEVLHVKNISKNFMVIQESDFSSNKKTKLISITKRSLEPNESTLVYVVSNV